MEALPQTSVPPWTLQRADPAPDQSSADFLAKRCGFLQITEEDCRRVRVLAPLFHEGQRS